MKQVGKVLQDANVYPTYNSFTLLNVGMWVPFYFSFFFCVMLSIHLCNFLFLKCACQGVECRAVLGSAQIGSGEAKITFISIFFSHNRAYTESTWPSFRLLAPPLGTDTPPLYQLTRDWYIPIPLKVFRLCIQPGHIVRDCLEFLCRKCGKQGHPARECVAVMKCKCTHRVW